MDNVLLLSLVHVPYFLEWRRYSRSWPCLEARGMWLSPLIEAGSRIKAGSLT